MTVLEQTKASAAIGTIPATMRAAVYRGINDVRLETVPVPAIGPGELLLRVHTCGICGTDLKKIHTGSHSAPRIFGHETSGMVAAVGAGVTRFKPGDRVIAFHHIPCGDCYYCRHKTFAQCETYKKVGCTAGLRSQRRRLRRIRPGHGLDRPRGCGKDPRPRLLRAGLFRGTGEYLPQRRRHPPFTGRGRRFWSLARGQSASCWRSWPNGQGLG